MVALIGLVLLTAAPAPGGAAGPAIVAAIQAGAQGISTRL